jgi:hypothetical protein
MRSASSTASSGGGKRYTLFRRKTFFGDSGRKMQDLIWCRPVDMTSLGRPLDLDLVRAVDAHLTAMPAKIHP